jgi:hypothetical protein
VQELVSARINNGALRRLLGLGTAQDQPPKKLQTVHTTMPPWIPLHGVRGCSRVPLADERCAVQPEVPHKSGKQLWAVGPGQLACALFRIGTHLSRPSSTWCPEERNVHANSYDDSRSCGAQTPGEQRGDQNRIDDLSCPCPKGPEGWMEGLRCIGDATGLAKAP